MAEHPAPPWQSMRTAPRNASTILLRFPPHGLNRPQVMAAHFAEGGGEEQPRFGPGWFYPVLGDKGQVLLYAEIHAEPDGWMPLPEGANA